MRDMKLSTLPSPIQETDWCFVGHRRKDLVQIGGYENVCCCKKNCGGAKRDQSIFGLLLEYKNLNTQTNCLRICRHDIRKDKS